MSVSMQLIRSRVDDVPATRCTIFSFSSGLGKKNSSRAADASGAGVSFALEAGYDEQATANSNYVFKCSDHQVGNFESFH
jgi:hypothetical protein